MSVKKNNLQCKYIDTISHSEVGRVHPMVTGPCAAPGTPFGLLEWHEWPTGVQLILTAWSGFINKALLVPEPGGARPAVCCPRRESGPSLPKGKESGDDACTRVQWLSLFVFQDTM